MATQEDKLIVDLDLRAKKLAETQAQLKSISESLKNTAKFVKEAGSSFTKFDTEISKSVTALRKFDRNLKEFGKGDAIVRLNQTMLQLQKNITKAAEGMQVLRYAEKRQTIGNASSIGPQIQGQALRVGQAQLAAEMDRTNRAAQQRLAIEKQTLDRLKEQQVLLQRNASIETQIASMNAKANNPKFLAAQNQLREQSILSNSGASLFKIQASLLVNYTLMNQLFNLFQFGTKFVIDLDNSFKDLQAITATTNTEMTGLKQTIIDVSQGTKFSAVEVADAAKVLAQAGFSAREINESIKGVVLLATATGTDLATSVDVASSAISVFELRAEDMMRVANVLTGALNETKLTMDKVALGIQYAGNIANEAGLSFEETVAVLGAMSNAGIRSGSTLGTGLRQVLVELLNPTDKLRNKLAEVGLTIRDVDIKSKGFVGVMRTLRDAGFTTADAFESLEVRSAAAFAAIQNDPEIITQLERSFLFTSAAAKANEIQMGSLSAAIKVFTNNLGLAINQLAGPFVEALRVVLNGLSGVLGALESLNVILPIVGTAVISFGAAWGTLKLIALVKNLNLIGGAMATIANVSKATSIGGMLAALVGSVNPVVALGLAITGVASALFLFSTASKRVQENMDQLRAGLDKAKGEFDSTKESANSVEKELSRLTDRLVELKDSPEAVFNEFLSLENQFGSLGFEIENTTNPSIYDLIGALDKLKGKLQETSVEQLKLIQNQRSLLFLEQGKQIRGLGKEGIAEDFYSFASQSRAPGKVDARLNAINTSVSNLAVDPSSITDQARRQLLQQITTQRSALIKLNNAVINYMKDLQKSGEEGTSEYKALQYKQQKITDSLAKVNEFAGNLTDFITDSAVQIKEGFKTTDLSTQIQAAIQQYDEDLSVLRDRKTNSNAERVQLEAEIKALGDNLTKAVRELVAKNMGIAVDALKDSGLEIDDSDIAVIKQSVETDVKQAVEEGRGDINKLSESTKETVNVAMEQAAAGLEAIKNAYQQTALEFDTKIKKFDAIAREAQDLERGGLAGKYSDTEISMMQDKQKALQIDAMRARLNQLPGIIAATDAVAGQKGQELSRLKNLANTPENQSQRISKEREINSIINERKNLQQELLQVQDEYNAMIGKETEAHATLGQQLEYVLQGYMKQMEIQQQWSYQLKENVTKVLDDARSAFKDFVTDTVTGTKSVGDAFKDMGRKILESMLDIVSNKLASQAMGGLGSIFGSILPSIFGGGGGGTSIPNPNIAGTSYMLNGGGLIRAAGGANVGRDNQLILARKGEFVLRNSAVDMIGRDNLAALNAQGNRQISAASSNIMGVANQGQATGGGGMVNVWVVAPEEKPSLTKNDVLVTITDDMSRGGATKKLVKSIALGQM